MESVQLKELKNYLMGFDEEMLKHELCKEAGIYTVCWAAFGILLWVLVRENILLPLLIIGSIGLVICILTRLLTHVWLPRKKLDQDLHKVEEDGRLADLCFDFETADRCWDGQLRLGQWWIFSEGSGRIVSYEDIICCSKDGRPSNSRGTWLSVLLNSEQKLVCLSEMPVKKDEIEDIDLIMETMKEREDDICILSSLEK